VVQRKDKWHRQMAATKYSDKVVRDLIADIERFRQELTATQREANRFICSCIRDTYEAICQVAEDARGKAVAQYRTQEIGVWLSSCRRVHEDMNKVSSTALDDLGDIERRLSALDIGGGGEAAFFAWHRLYTDAQSSLQLCAYARERLVATFDDFDGMDLCTMADAPTAVMDIDFHPTADMGIVAFAQQQRCVAVASPFVVHAVGDAPQRQRQRQQQAPPPSISDLRIVEKEILKAAHDRSALADELARIERSGDTSDWAQIVRIESCSLDAEMHTLKERRTEIKSLL
jgi:hypothetical protein